MWKFRFVPSQWISSLEHKIFYKYNKDVPEHLTRELKSAADSANALDHQMERLHREIQEIKDAENERDEEELRRIIINNQQFTLPNNLLRLLGDGEN